MKKYKFEIKLSLVLLFISFILYLLIYIDFRGTSNLLLSILSQLAFLPIYILLVTIFLENIINRKDKKAMMQKLNVIIGAFFNEFGRELLKIFFEMDNNVEAIKLNIASCKSSDTNYKYILKCFSGYNSTLSIKAEEFYKIKEFMRSKRELLLNLMSNPNLMEHDDFTEMLLAVFHLYQELELRVRIDENNPLDYEHLEADTLRAYLSLIKQWIAYLNHLKDAYPYLFSLEMRVNPLDTDATIEIS